MNIEVNIQDTFLHYLVTQKVPVAVYLKNGIKLKGLITHFDEHSIFLDQPSLQMIFKDAISTIMELPTI